jgi:hypothetical protein
LYPHTVDLVGGSLPVAHRAAAIPVQIDPEEPLRRECLAFLDAISTGERPLADACSAMDVLRVLEAAQQSLDGLGMPQVLQP